MHGSPLVPLAAGLRDADRWPGWLRVLRGAGGEDGSLVVFRGVTCYIILNKYPYNNGHLMVVPNRHVASLGEATGAELCELIELARRAEVAVREAYAPHGLNLGINLGKSAGAGILDHLHMHVIPRWNGDTNFMTVVGETRVLPEDLLVTAERLRPVFEKLKELEAVLMILELTDDQKAFQTKVARFATDRVAPAAAAIDEQGAFPRELVREAAAIGLMGVTVGAEWGGAGKRLHQLRARRRSAGQRERGRRRDCGCQQLARRGAHRSLRLGFPETHVASASRERRVARRLRAIRRARRVRRGESADRRAAR